MEPEVLTLQLLSVAIPLDVQAEHVRGRIGGETEAAPDGEDASRFWYRFPRVGERHRTPIAEDDIEAAIRERQSFGGCPHQGEDRSLSGGLLLGLAESLVGEVESHDPRPASLERDRPVGRP